MADDAIELVCAGSMGDGALIQRFVQQVSRFHMTVPLVNLEVSKQPDHYRYEFTAADGRQWKQKIRIMADTSEMTFHVPDYWRLTEFELHRPIRDTVILMITAYDLQKLEWKS